MGLPFVNVSLNRATVAQTIVVGLIIQTINLGTYVAAFAAANYAVKVIWEL